MKTLAKGRFLELVVDDSGWEFVRRVRGSTPVGIIAVTQEGNLLLISQHRLPVGGAVIEIPAGLVGDHDAGESWQDAAKRELLEETGYCADAVEELALGPTSAGLTSELIRIVRARGVRKVGVPQGDPSEQITVHEVPLASVDRWLAEQHRKGALVDPKVYAALWFAMR
jgi:ADP-ribose pyrophosphatase